MVMGGQGARLSGDFREETYMCIGRVETELPEVVKLILRPLERAKIIFVNIGQSVPLCGDVGIADTCIGVEREGRIHVGGVPLFVLVDGRFGGEKGHP